MAQNTFDTVAVTRPNYSSFDLSHDHKTSLRMGNLVPVWTQEVLPGDSYSLKSEAMFRMMPMVAPILHRCDITFHSFFVPNRLCWKNWEKFITGGELASGVGVPPAHPTIALTEVQASSLPNYMGLPVVPTAGSEVMEVNALPFMAYQLIYKEWYRDQNLQPLTGPGWAALEANAGLSDGLQSVDVAEVLTELQKRAWEHDYFTSALPFAQKGESVELPLDFQDVTIKYRPGQDTIWKQSGTNTPAGAGNTVTVANDGVNIGTPSGVALSLDPNGSLIADGDDLSTFTTIQDLRNAWALQQWLEKNMRAGSRYKESLQAHFGVISSDARLQRPQYIGGSKGTLAISEVLQTSSSDAPTPQGNMAGHGISVMGMSNKSFRSEEHGFIITLVSILPKTAYFQGIPRMFSKTDRMLYAWPEFAQLGEQEILKQELYFNANDDGYNKEVFGYIPRYAEYRYQPSRVSGEMATTLLHWHMARHFATPPQLNGTFIAADPTDRIYAVEDDSYDKLVAQIYFDIRAKRALPVYGIPAPLM